MHRRQFLGLAGATLAAGFSTQARSQAQGWPNKPVKLILLNINGKERHPDFPDLQTLTELGVEGADVPIWFSIYAPAGTPKEIISKLNAKMIEIAKTDDMKAKMRAVNAFVPLQAPDDMAKHLAEDIRINAELIKVANIKID